MTEEKQQDDDLSPEVKALVSEFVEQWRDHMREYFALTPGERARRLVEHMNKTHRQIYNDDSVFNGPINSLKILGMDGRVVVGPFSFSHAFYIDGNAICGPTLTIQHPGSVNMIHMSAPLDMDGTEDADK